METYRNGTFETNSSSSHVLTLGNKLRPIEEFPVPDADGVIHLDVPRDENGYIDFAPCPEKFIDFLVLCIGMTAEGEDPRVAVPSHSEQKRIIKWLNIIYKMVGLPEVKSIKMTWTASVEISHDGEGDVSDRWVETTNSFQNNGLESFLRSLAYDVRPDNEQPWMAKVLEPIPEEEYQSDVLLYNAALALVANSTGSIEGN